MEDNKKILITGGAGYIGSHAVKMLKNANYHPIILDNFSTGHKWAVEGYDFFECDLLDKSAVEKVFLNNNFYAIMHFAAKSIVSESVREPLLYYSNNVIGSINLIDLALKYSVKKFVFSSTAAVYGEPRSKIINESHPLNPINPYGHSKLMVENILKDTSKSDSNSLSAICFRYFNAAGADPSGLIGELHDPETHLIPNILSAALNSRSNTQLKIFGNDYDTKDGTCVRDYVHVNDIVDAHIKSLSFLEKNHGFHSYNLGNGQGYSVLEVINECSKILKQKLHFNYHDRRSGDPAYLVASSNAAKKNLYWNPSNSSLNNICLDALNWHTNLNKYHK